MVGASEPALFPPRPGHQFPKSCYFRCSRAIFLYTNVNLPAHSVDLESGGNNTLVKEKKAAEQEDSAAKLQKLAEEKRFRMKEAMAQRGGSEAFLRWLRSDAAKKA